MTGTVKDPSGDAVPRARVSLINAREAVLGSTQSDEQGRFTLSGIPPGDYELLVTDEFAFLAQRRFRHTPLEADEQLNIALDHDTEARCLAAIMRAIGTFRSACGGRA